MNDLLISKLSPLINIIDTFDPPPNDDIKYTPNDIEMLQDSILDLIDEYIKHNIDTYKLEKFNLFIEDYVYDILQLTYINIAEIFYYIDISDIIQNTMIIYFQINNNTRSYKNTFDTCEDQQQIKERIEYVSNIPQHEQGSNEWYKYRYGRLTASDIYKALDTDSNKNALIFKKCKPLDLNKCNSVNTNSAMHWGHKYEPLSTMIYEKQYDTIIKEFGCITHDNYDFLGASPDGLNIKYGNPRYGRLLEIKNPTTRKITGIPKKEYWVQMQLQMEVWDFNYVDFLETSFKEYNNEDEFLKDGTFTLTNDNKMKGIIIQFQDNNNNPYYEYMPIGFTRNEYENWYETIFKKNEEKNYIWITTSYWRLDDISCVLVPRNKKWFNYALPQFRSLWDIIKKERVSGSEHRAPKRKAKSKIPKSPPVTFKFSTESFDEIMFVENELEL